MLKEKISPENIAVMAELIAMRETKTLIGFMGYHAEKAHKKLCKDIFCKDMPEYVLSDSYDLVQNVALFLCNHCGEYLDDLLYVSKKRKANNHQNGMLSHHHENVVQEIQADAKIPKP